MQISAFRLSLIKHFANLQLSPVAFIVVLVMPSVTTLACILLILQERVTSSQNDWDSANVAMK